MTDDAGDDSDRNGERDSLEKALHERLAPDTARSLEEPVRVGPFRLEQRIGEGGMGAVYRAVHRETTVPVAVKVIQRVTDAVIRKRFHREVQAHAGLLHPGIVYLFEYGELPADVEESAAGLSAGSPYVAMELADGGTVREAMPLSGWGEVHRTLVQVLDALAHAHARGVVHRDLKPENLLLFEGDDSSAVPRVKLADFGIAHAFGDEKHRETDILSSPIGTPAYMAPEQFSGSWREYGPWTDLYAIGCIAWELISGRSPFVDEDRNFVELSILHQDGERPPLDPQFPVPEALEEWIRRCMAPAPERRFRRAADALWNLPSGEDLDNAARRPSGGAGSEQVEYAPTRVPTFEATAVLDERDESALAETLPESHADAPDSPERDGVDRSERSPRISVENPRPPVPSTWHRGETASRPAPLVGTGLGLFGLREPPFVDRDVERDRIWGALRRLGAEGGTELVSIEGETGTGKSRLANWTATRAHEVGAAEVVRAVHTRSGGQREGLRGALERTFRAVKMSRSEVYEHLQERLPALEEGDEDMRRRDARALTEYLRPTDDRADEIEGPRYRFASVRHRQGLLIRVLRRIANRRPMVLWLDDLQWGKEALGVVERLAEDENNAPEILVLATLRSDILREQQRVRERIEALHDGSTSEHIELDPLTRTDQRRLLEGLLPLEEDLSVELAERTEGHPLFAMQLLAHWIEREHVVVGAEGFRVPAEREAELPEDIHDLWMERLHRMVGRFPRRHRETSLRAIERAAALGREVDEEEWRHASRNLEVDQLGAIQRSLVDRGLAESTQQGWAFTHGLLVDSLAQFAREQNRWRQHHRQCARMLAERYGDHLEEVAVRRADHLIEAGEWERALEPLMDEIRRLRQLGDPEAIRDVLDRRADLLDRLDIPADDPRRIENDIERACIDLTKGVPSEELLASLEEARERAERAGADRLVSRTYQEAARCRVQLGEPDAARSAADRAVQRARAGDDETTLIAALYRSGWSEYFSGNLDAARERFSEAHERAIEDGDHYRELFSQRSLAAVASTSGNHDRAEALYEECVTESREAGYRSIEVTCLNGLGETARFNGGAEKAREWYRAYGELGREVNIPSDVAMAQSNLGQVELMAGRFDVAARHLREAERRYEEISRRDEHHHLLRLGELTVAAGRGHWSTFDACLDDYADGWPDNTPMVKDYPWLLELAADYAAEAGERERAERAWELAVALWEQLGDDEAARQLRDRLAE